MKNLEILEIAVKELKEEINNINGYSGKILINLVKILSKWEQLALKENSQTYVKFQDMLSEVEDEILKRMK